ncbi:MAG: hypothetical protein JSS26_06245 [Nitrospira sp.]|nr:hypothetical protein [Nitrospira sp.]
MILHCTRKLAARIPASAEGPAEDRKSDDVACALARWHGHVLTFDRRQCLLFCNDATRYVLFLPGLRAAQFAELGRWHRNLFLAVLQAQGLPESRLARIALTLGPLTVDRETDRSVLGSMGVVADDLKYGLLNRIPNVMELDPIATSLSLSDRPCAIHKTWIWPLTAMQELVERL